MLKLGLVKEPLEIDFYVDPTPLTKEEEKSISDFIQADKLKRSVKVKVRSRKQRSEHDSCQKDLLTNFLNHKAMGLVKEPEGIDFVIQSKPFTTKQEKELSEFIAKRKLEIKKRLKKTRSRKILNPES